MTIGLLQMELLLPGTNSLKDKRSLLKRITNQVRKKYNVAFSELSDQDSYGRAHIGVVTLANQSSRCHSILSNTENFISQNFDVLLSNRIMEMF
ncbi:MAG: DUF503 domain-containing protein [Fidelibacterota bacterium]